MFSKNRFLILTAPLLVLLSAVTLLISGGKDVAAVAQAPSLGDSTSCEEMVPAGMFEHHKGKYCWHRDSNPPGETCDFDSPNYVLKAAGVFALYGFKYHIYQCVELYDDPSTPTPARAVPYPVASGHAEPASTAVFPLLSDATANGKCYSRSHAGVSNVMNNGEYCYLKEEAPTNTCFSNSLVAGKLNFRLRVSFWRGDGQIYVYQCVYNAPTPPTPPPTLYTIVYNFYSNFSPTQSVLLHSFTLRCTDGSESSDGEPKTVNGSWCGVDEVPSSTRTGYVFLGWAASPTSTTISIEKDWPNFGPATVTGDGVRNSYAVWERENQEFEAQFNANHDPENDGDYSEYAFLPELTQKCSTGTSTGCNIKLPEMPDTFKVPGYTFKGWSSVSSRPGGSNCELARSANSPSLNSHEEGSYYVTSRVRRLYSCWVRDSNTSTSNSSSSGSSTPSTPSAPSAPSTPSAPSGSSGSSGSTAPLPIVSDASISAVSRDNSCAFINVVDGSIRAYKIVAFNDDQTQVDQVERIYNPDLLNNDSRCPQGKIFLPVDDSSATSGDNSVLYELAPHYRNWEKFGSVGSGSQVPVYVEGGLTSIYALFKLGTGRNFVSLGEFCFQFTCHWGWTNTGSRDEGSIEIWTEESDDTHRRIHITHKIGTTRYIVAEWAQGQSATEAPAYTRIIEWNESGTDSIMYGNRGDLPRLATDRRELINAADVLVPIRFLAEGLGYTVDWDSSARQINITGGRY